MVKRKFFYIGLLIFLFGVFLTIRDISLTGFMISNITGISESVYLFYLLLIVFGILITMTGDSLQEWLREKENKASSPSLENKVQTKEERKYFSKRYSGTTPWYKRIKKSDVERIKQDDAKYTKELIDPQDYATNLNETQEKYRREQDKEIIKTIPELRKSISKSKKRMDELSENGDIHDYVASIEDFATSIENLYESLDRFNFPRSKRVEERYNEFAKKGAKRVISKNSEEIRRNVRENEFGFSHQSNNPIQEKQGLIERLRNAFFPDQDIPSMEELEEIYINEGKTIPLSDYSREHIFLHSFPLGRDANPNTFGAQHNHKTPADYFVDYIEKEKPLLSVTSIPKKSSGNPIVRHAGIILKKGEIYDASPNNLYSRATADKKRRFRSHKGHANLPIEERVKAALRKNSKNDHNEYIVGNYEIGGLYLSGIVSKEKKKEIAPIIAKKALELGVPLYEVNEKGFQEIDPKKY